MSGMLRVAFDAPTALVAHTVLEMTGIFVGMRVLAVNLRRHALGSIAGGDGYAIALGCIVGAIAGSKLAVWIDRPDLTHALWATPRLWLMGQSIVGALIGGLEARARRAHLHRRRVRRAARARPRDRAHRLLRRGAARRHLRRSNRVALGHRLR
jgi:prolipoprotein diacylglyceryltransferase